MILLCVCSDYPYHNCDLLLLLHFLRKSILNTYYQHIQVLFKRVLLFLLLMQISRAVFVFYNFDFFHGIGIFELISTFIKGIHFDFAAFVYFNILFLILSLIPGHFKDKKEYQKILKLLFVSINSFVLLINLGDAEYFRFNFKRLTYDMFCFVFSSEMKVWGLLPQFLMDYWHIIILWLLSVWGLVQFYPSLKQGHKESKTKTLTLVYQSFVSFLLLFICLVPVRGVGVRPINLNTAAVYSSIKNMHIVLNTPYSIVRTIGKSGLERKHYFSEEQQQKIFKAEQKINNSGRAKLKNVVIIILESFSKEYIDKGYTPFLNSLSKKGLYFENAFANGKRSIESLPSIFASIPSLMDKPYATSPYASNQINSIAQILKKHRYHTTFFHGGKNGTMGFDTFTKVAGFDAYYGLNEYPDKSHFDGHWGIFDEEYLSYFADKLDEFKTPFVSGVFTLSSHHPYTVPEKYTEQFPEGEIEITKVVSYSDYALAQFFKKASKMDWYKNTLFVITADHTGYAISSENNNKVGGYKIPILFFCPSDSKLRGTSYKIVQQADILPSVIDYLNLSERLISFGHSVFDSRKGFAVNYTSGIYTFIKGNYALIFNGKSSTALYAYKNDPHLKNNLLSRKPEIAQALEKELKAYIQSYNKRLIDNQTVVEHQ